MPSGRSKTSTTFESAAFHKNFPLSRHALPCNDDYNFLQCFLPLRFIAVTTFILTSCTIWRVLLVNMRAMTSLALLFHSSMLVYAVSLPSVGSSMKSLTSS